MDRDIFPKLTLPSPHSGSDPRVPVYCRSFVMIIWTDVKPDIIQDLCKKNQKTRREQFPRILFSDPVINRLRPLASPKDNGVHPRPFFLFGVHKFAAKSEGSPVEKVVSKETSDCRILSGIRKDGGREPIPVNCPHQK